MVNTTLIRVSSEDKRTMLNECKELFLKEHPEFKEYNITERFMFNRLVRYFQR